MANEDGVIGLKGSKKDPTRTAREAVDRTAMNAIVTLFLLRDGLVLPDEFAEPLLDNERQAELSLILYAELSGLLKPEAAQAAHDRATLTDREG